MTTKKLKQRFIISENKSVSYKKYSKLSDIFLKDTKVWLKQKRAIYEHTKPLQDLRHKWFDELLEDLE